LSVRSARLRFLLGCAALAVAAALGAAVAISIPAARAGVTPTLPTVTLPVSLPLPTLPTIPSLPVVTTTTATTSPAVTSTTPTTTSSDNGGGGRSVTTTATSLPVVAETGIAGAIRLPSGAFSIPIAGVTAPARLGIDRLTISPKWIRARGQRLRVVVRVIDSRGYRVRGASVDARSNPARMIMRTAAGTTGKDGTVSLQLSTSARIPLRAGSKLTLVVRAYQAGAASSSNATRRNVSIPIRPR
jgi:hypothetical protein